MTSLHCNGGDVILQSPGITRNWNLIGHLLVHLFWQKTRM